MTTIRDLQVLEFLTATRIASTRQIQDSFFPGLNPSISYDRLKYLADNINNYELIYKTNKLMYENTTIKKNKVIYDYYDSKTYKKISSTTLEK